MKTSIALRCATAAVAASIALAAPPTAPARADQVMTTGAAPVVSIRATGGVVRIVEGAPGALRVVGDARANISRFRVSRQVDGRIWLPRKQVRAFVGGRWRTVRMSARQWTVPSIRDGADGFNIDNFGVGDITVAMPRQHGALFINAGSARVVLERTRGPYVIESTDGMVELHGVAGRGLIRTETGAVDLTNVGGQVFVFSASGRIVSRNASAERVEARTAGGDIDWIFARLGKGAYRFTTDTGDIRIGLRASMGALVDAQSGNGNVVNGFAPGSADVRIATDRELSLSVGGGGPQITAQSKRGSISIGTLADK